jgi:hypothetical protein
MGGIAALKKNGQWGSRVFYDGMIGLMLGAFMWFARNNRHSMLFPRYERAWFRPRGNEF